MRIDQAAAAAAYQTRLLGLLKGQEETRALGFKAEGPAPAPGPQTSAPAQGAAGVPASSLAVLVAACAALMPRPAAIRRAEKGLASLERLHRMVRTGAFPAGVLDELAGWRDEGRHGDGDDGEGATGDLLDEIELRILVELARRGR